jgi:peptide chain release factor 1
MLDKIQGFLERYEEINQALLEVGEDYQRATELAIERAEMESVVKKAREYQAAMTQWDEAKAILYGDDPELAELAQMEAAELEEKIPVLEEALKRLLLPKDPRDERNVIMEIRAGAGGDEAGIFAADLFRMYTRYAELVGWSTEVVSSNETGVGGFKEVTLEIKGKGAFSRLKYESGVHRVQRVPETESQGRIHTSTATVAVLAEVDEVDIEIPASDLNIDVYKSAGAGGQNVQKNATAIRITHLPTGMVVTCQDERSQTQNRLRAMGILRARLYELEEQKRAAEIAATRKGQVGSGDRSEKIRTYNYPQSRLTDHRIGYSNHNLPAIMEGNIDEVLDELATYYESERLAAAGMNE